MTQFQLALMLMFGLAAVGGLLAFATFRGSGEVAFPIELTMWGTPPSTLVGGYFSSLDRSGVRPLVIRYTEKKAETFERDLVEAIADGRGPDLVFIPDSLIISLARRIQSLPLERVTQRYFFDTYGQAAETFWGPRGAFGAPIAIDPFFFYWNRDHLQSAGIAKPPTQWSALPGLSERLTVRDRSFEISRSTIAMGESANINNAREILATFLLQSGNPITAYRDQALVATLGGDNIESSIDALDFFTQFSNPTYPVYSWNRSLPEARDAFIADKLTFYLGFASEARIIREKNPNLNFDIAPMPQPLSAKIKTTLARSYGIVALRTSPKAADARDIILSIFMSSDASAYLALALGIAPARRDLLSVPPGDVYGASLYESAIMGRSWLDPDPEASFGVFGRMINSTISGEKNSLEAVTRGQKELESVTPVSVY